VKRKVTLAILPAIWIAIAAVIAGIPWPAFAQTSISPDPSRDQQIIELRKEIKQLEQRVDTLQGLDNKVQVIDRKLDVETAAQQAQIKSEQAQAKNAPIIKAGTQGFSLGSPDGDWQFGLHGIVQADARFFANGTDKTPSTFYLNKARPIFTATFDKYYGFNITPDFGQGKVVLQDAYISADQLPWAQFRVGKFKAPFGLERLQLDTYVVFSQRAETNNLVPNRDYGAEVRGGFFDNRLTYQLAIMNGVPNNTATVESDVNDGKDFIGRIFAEPFKDSGYPWAKGLGLGYAVTYGDERGSTTSVYKTYGQVTWFSYNSGVTAAGRRYRLSPQGYYYWGPFGLLAEYVSDDHALNRYAILKEGKFTKPVNDYATFTDDGYSVEAVYALTGESESYYGLTPRRNFSPEADGWGAWELDARISNVATDSGQYKLAFASAATSATTATEFALGLAWYPSQNVKWQYDYANTFFNGGAGTTTAPKDRPNESVFETQIQLAF
jgi:phosphate-selective porin OprO/OprP